MTEVLRDVVFSEPPGFRPLSLDLFLPAVRPAPAIVFVHGGGWRLGSRRTFVPHRSTDRMFGRITSAGLAVASIDYRLSGEARFPAPVDDVVAAISWIRERGGDLGLDGSRVVAWGESSGAHLALLAGLRPDTGLAAVIDWYGPTDLVGLGRDLYPDAPDRFDGDPATREAGLLGGAVGQRLDLARAASPALQAHAGSPPLLVLHGDEDTLVPLAQSRRLVAAMEGVGVAVDFEVVLGASHFWRGVDDLEPLLDRSIAYAHRALDSRRR